MVQPWVARPESSKGVGLRQTRPSKTQGVPPDNDYSLADSNGGIGNLTVSLGLSAVPRLGNGNRGCEVPAF